MRQGFEDPIQYSKQRHNLKLCLRAQFHNMSMAQYDIVYNK